MPFQAEQFRVTRIIEDMSKIQRCSTKMESSVDKSEPTVDVKFVVIYTCKMTQFALGQVNIQTCNMMVFRL